MLTFNRFAILSVFLFSSQAILSMQQIERSKIFSPKKRALNLVATYYLSDHETIRSFGKTSKHYNNLMLTMAEQRKNLLLSEDTLTLPKNIGIIWHKYGSACYYAYPRTGKNTGGLALMALQLSPTRHKQFRAFEDFVSPLSYNPMPFFNNADQMCFHGIGKTMTYLAPCYALLSTEIVRYCFNGNGFRCTMSSDVSCIKDYKLIFFLEYPNLLKALLNSKNVVIRNRYKKCGLLIETYLTYYLDEATIPHDYAHRIPVNNPPTDAIIRCFENFPDCIKYAIEKRRRECIEQEIEK